MTRLGAHRTSLGAPLEGDPRVVVFDPSPALRVWPDALAEAWRKLDEARALLAGDESARAQAAALVREAHQSGDGIVFAFQWARALHQSGRSEEAVSVLEAALGRAARGDWEYRMRARSLLAELYHAQALEREAAEQHRIVLENAYRTELLEKARSYLSGQSR